MRPAHRRLVPVLRAVCVLVTTVVTMADRAPAQAPHPQATPSSATTSAQPPAARPGDFDYLLGDWQFTGVSKRWGRLGGVWSAVRLATGDGTHVLDEYRILGDSGHTIFASTTLRVLNRPGDRWELVTAAPGSGVADRGTARRVGDEMHVEQVFNVAAGTPEQWRIRYFHIRPDGFSWTGDRSTDGGRTWDAGYLQLEATRVGPPRDLPSLAQARVPASAP